MSRQSAGIFIALGGGLLTGVLATWGEAIRRAEISARERAQQQIDSYVKAHQMAETLREAWTDGPVDTEEELDPTHNLHNHGPLDGPDTSDDAIKVGGEMIQETALSAITPSVDYLASAREYSESSVSAPESPLEYISEDEYGEEDGRAKEQILIHMGADEPIFINEGIVIPNWAELISPNILVDMYQKIPPGEDRVLYVRNHQNHTDYEVVQEIP